MRIYPILLMNCYLLPSRAVAALNSLQRKHSSFYDEYGDGNALTSVTFAEGSVELEEIEIHVSVEEICDDCFSYCSISCTEADWQECVRRV